MVVESAVFTLPSPSVLFVVISEHLGSSRLECQGSAVPFQLSLHLFFKQCRGFWDVQIIEHHVDNIGYTSRYFKTFSLIYTRKCQVWIRVNEIFLDTYIVCFWRAWNVPQVLETILLKLARF